jgi:hypothetical protein
VLGSDIVYSADQLHGRRVETWRGNRAWD